MTDELKEKVAQHNTDIALLSQTVEATNTTIERNTKATNDKIDKLCDAFGDYAEKNDKTTKGIDEALRGKDSDNPGLFTRMDRQERFSARMKAILGTIITSIAGIITMLVGNFLGMFGKGH